MSKVIIDTDPGMDDAVALLILFKHLENYKNSSLNLDKNKYLQIDVIALTTTFGNVSVDKVAINAQRILNVSKLQIPVYRGSNSPLIKTGQRNASHYHGTDGMGDMGDDLGSFSVENGEHAALALVRLVNQFQGEISLVCLAPLTNIALAMRLDESFTSKLKQCIIMGGNYKGKGNITSSAEFNFYSDPEAAHIVLTEMQCPVTLVTWELCLENSLSWDFYEELTNQDSTISKFVKRMYTKNVSTFYSDRSAGGFVTCDEIATAILINPDVVAKSVDVACDVELAGRLTRGQMAVQWLEKGRKNIRVVTEINVPLYHEILSNTFR